MKTLLIGLLAAATTSLGAATLPTVSPAEAHGVVAIGQRIAANIFPAVITRIDGVSVVGAADTGRTAWWLAPGEHTLKLVPLFDDRAGTIRGARNHRNETSDMKLTVQEGKRYLVGAKITGATFNDWEPVLLSESDLPNS
ncbi:MAG: hypothetical protein LJE84_04030 [Gammaproteobacteria bacterium]|nr:hypothetical protein [Gammaproteobacteria bacterium]